MENLIQFLRRIQDWLLLAFFEAVSIALLVTYNSYQGSVWLSSANTVNGFCYSLYSRVDGFFALSALNEQLTQRNAQLEQQLALLRETKSETHSSDSFLLKNITLTECRMIPAKVVQNSVHRNDNLITIDKGSADGIRKDMGVVSGTGVVGIVYLVGTHYSVVISVLNKDSSISCRIRRRGYFGYLRWKGGDSRYAYLEEIPRHAHYGNGDIVETSGFSSIFPPGLQVGRIVCSFNSTDGLSYRAKVELSADFGRLRDVCVIDNSAMVEQLEILHAAKDSLSEQH